ncbi:MAG: hypothetical protein RLZZ293_553 [Pseudomonadota bacterium]|jgi:hypothetical protein
MEKCRQSDTRSLENNSAPVISLLRQAQFIQAIATLVGIILGNSVSQWFYMLSILSGISLLFASLADECIIIKLLSRLPWNK